MLSKTMYEDIQGCDVNLIIKVFNLEWRRQSAEKVKGCAHSYDGQNFVFCRWSYSWALKVTGQLKFTQENIKIRLPESGCKTACQLACPRGSQLQQRFLSDQWTQEGRVLSKIIHHRQLPLSPKQHVSHFIHSCIVTCDLSAGEGIFLCPFQNNNRTYNTEESPCEVQKTCLVSSFRNKIPNERQSTRGPLVPPRAWQLRKQKLTLS